jgi:signal recognition particle subunit SRP68
LLFTYAPSLVLSVTTESRQQHGLKRRDFIMYRKYSGRKLRRLRIGLNRTHGKGKVFMKYEISADQVREPRHLYQFLFEAERAWAYAMHLKQKMERTQEELRTKGIYVRPREYYHFIKKLRKAVHYAENMLSISRSAPCTLRTQLHVEAYCDYLKGQLAFEEERWENSLDFLGLTKHLYENLARTAPSKDDIYYREHLRELDEFIRVASFQLRSSTDMKPEELKEFLNRLSKTDSVAIDFLSSNLEVS